MIACEVIINVRHTGSRCQSQSGGRSIAQQRVGADCRREMPRDPNAREIQSEIVCLSKPH